MSETLTFVANLLAFAGLTHTTESVVVTLVVILVSLLSLVVVGINSYKYSDVVGGVTFTLLIIVFASLIVGASLQVPTKVLVKEERVVIPHTEIVCDSIEYTNTRDVISVGDYTAHAYRYGFVTEFKVTSEEVFVYVDNYALATMSYDIGTCTFKE